MVEVHVVKLCRTLKHFTLFETLYCLHVHFIKLFKTLKIVLIVGPMEYCRCRCRLKLNNRYTQSTCQIEQLFVLPVATYGKFFAWFPNFRYRQLCSCIIIVCTSFAMVCDLEQLCELKYCLSAQKSFCLS